MKKTTLITILNLILFVNNTYSQDGSLDTTFDGDGKVTTAFGSFNDIGGAIAIQPDGKIIVVGYSENSTDADIAVVRYNVNGSLDTTFDGDGKVTTDIANSLNYLNAIAIQSDGKIVVAGYTGTSASADFAIVRYNSNGSLDTSFDADGKVTTAIGTAGDFGNAIAIQNDGKIIVVGTTAVGSSFDFALVKYNANGSLDTSFDSDGMVITDIATFSDEAYSLTIQPDGKIVVVGSAANGSNNDFAVARYNSDGSLDTSFDLDGKVMTAIGATDDRAKSVVIQNDGKIVVTGFSSATPSRNFATVRYNSNGSLDTSFDLDGKVITDFGVATSSSATTVLLQTDGQIIVAGNIATNGVNYNFALARYNSDGSLDANLDSDGRVTTDFGNNLNDFGYAMALQNDNKIVVAGTTVDAAFKYNFALVRYNNTSLSIVENKLQSFAFFPNPTSEYLFIQSGSQPFEDATVFITNTIGQVIVKKEHVNNPEIILDIAAQPNGFYLLTIENKGGKSTQKIIKN